MPEDKLLYVYANPWHGPLDHNHRACTALPWDPSDNPQRGFVGAQHRLDERGELYFEFDQYEGEHGVALTLKKDHAPIRYPATRYYLKALRDGTLWAADKATHQKAFGNTIHFRPVEDRAKAAPDGALARHKHQTQEDAEPKARPAKGQGRQGPSHAHRIIGGDNTATKAAEEALRLAIEETKATRDKLEAERAANEAADAKKAHAADDADATAPHADEGGHP